MKKLTAIILSAALIAALAGCAQQSANVNPVGFDAAKAAALNAAGVAEADARFEDVSLKEYNGNQYYEIEFEVGDRDYEYNIEALTGTVITPELAAEALGTGVQIPTGEKQPEQPVQPATEETKPAAEPVKEEVKPAAETPKQETPKAEKAADPQLIGESKAKSIALSHAGKKEADVKFVRTELDRDDGRTVYEVEFYDGNNMEYDYDIDAYSGEVVSFDYDAEDYKKPASDKKDESKPSDSSKTESTISEAKAKEIALAQVPGAKEADIRKFEVDRDDGRVEYEGEIVYDGMEYEFEIDGYSGAIRSWDVEKFDRYDD